MRAKRHKKLIPVLIVVFCVVAAFFAIKFSFEQYYKNMYPIRYKEEVEKYAEEYGVDPYLVYAVIHTESNFNPNANSHLNARGLMQIMDSTFQWAKEKLNDKDTTYDDLYNYKINIKYGVYILSLLSNEFESEDTVIAAYHAGWGNVKKWLKNKSTQEGLSINDIPIENTKDYVIKVKRTKKVYESLYKDDGGMFKWMQSN